MPHLKISSKNLHFVKSKFLDIKRVPKTRFDEMADMYLEKHAKPYKKSWTRDATCIKNLNPYFDKKLLSQVTPSDIDNYKSKRFKEVSPRTVNIEIKFLKAMFNKAISWGKAYNNPTDGVKLFKENNKRIRYLEKDEIRKLLNACSDELRPIIITALNTGMRKGEILKLRWENVDLDRKILYIIETKTGENREIPMTPMLYENLMNLQRRKNGVYVFPNKEGKPYVDIRKGFNTALKCSGIKDFRFHDLRHTFASRLAMNSVD